MRTVVQRVKSASVQIDGRGVSRIDIGLCCFVGVEVSDSNQDIEYTADKICSLRIFDDEKGQMNLDVAAEKGAILLISQFTLLGDARKGRRPSYAGAEPPVTARTIFERLVERVRELHSGTVATGMFQAEMDVAIVNHGPVAILLDSRKLF
jgi:D-tyrosyl-tRNA(Tyr) deacylase